MFFFYSYMGFWLRGGPVWLAACVSPAHHEDMFYNAGPLLFYIDIQGTILLYICTEFHFLFLSLCLPLSIFHSCLFFFCRLFCFCFVYLVLFLF